MSVLDMPANADVKMARVLNKLASWAESLPDGSRSVPADTWGDDHARLCGVPDDEAELSAAISAAFDAGRMYERMAAEVQLDDDADTWANG